MGLAVAVGMGDGGAERDRGPARRAESAGGGGRGGDRGGAEDLRAGGGGHSPTEVAGTSASSPAGSRESGADSDGQPGPGEADHCRRILVRGKGTARGPAPLDPHPTHTGAPDLLAGDIFQFIYSFIRHPVIHSNIILSVYCVLDIELSEGTKQRMGPQRSPFLRLSVQSPSRRPTRDLYCGGCRNGVPDAESLVSVP